MTQIRLSRLQIGQSFSYKGYDYIKANMTNYGKDMVDEEFKDYIWVIMTSIWMIMLLKPDCLVSIGREEPTKEEPKVKEEKKPVITQDPLHNIQNLKVAYIVVAYTLTNDFKTEPHKAIPFKDGKGKTCYIVEDQDENWYVRKGKWIKFLRTRKEARELAIKEPPNQKPVEHVWKVIKDVNTGLIVRWIKKSP